MLLLNLLRVEKQREIRAKLVNYAATRIQAKIRQNTAYLKVSNHSFPSHA